MSGENNLYSWLTAGRRILDSVSYFKLLIRAAARFFSGIPHPHLLGVCCPNLLSADSRFHTFPLSVAKALKLHV
jgi:hypothetical protein